MNVMNPFQINASSEPFNFVQNIELIEDCHSRGRAIVNDWLLLTCKVFFMQAKVNTILKGPYVLK